MQSWTLHAGSANLSQASFTEMLKSGTISRPHAEVLDTVERYYTHRMMACSSLRMAEEVYRAAQSMPGASTTKYFLAQHGLQVYIFPTYRWPNFVVNVRCHRGTAGPLRHTAACCYSYFVMCVIYRLLWYCLMGQAVTHRR